MPTSEQSSPPAPLPSLCPSPFRRFLAGRTWLECFNSSNDRAYSEQSHRVTPYNVSITLSSERVRFVAYVLFWCMCIFAIIITRTLVNPRLEKGPDPGRKGCPPFDNGKLPEYERVNGFNIEKSHLKENFGFNNICVNWDYAPSRQLTALVYPLFEYSLLLYVTLDFLLLMLSYRHHYVGRRLLQYACIAFIVQVGLISCFRMIFVAIAYDDVRSHTAGFLCLQLALFLVITMNVTYILETCSLLDRFDTRRVRRYRLVFWTYNILNFLSMLAKVYLTAFVVLDLGGETVYPNWALKRVLGRAIGQWVDLVWMVFNAIMPPIIALRRNRTEPNVKIVFDLTDVPEHFMGRR